MKVPAATPLSPTLNPSISFGKLRFRPRGRDKLVSKVRKARPDDFACELERGVGGVEDEGV